MGRQGHESDHVELAGHQQDAESSSRVWAQEVKYTVLELELAAKLGRPVDQQKFEFLQLKHQMDIDEQVYVR